MSHGKRLWQMRKDTSEGSWYYVLLLIQYKMEWKPIWSDSSARSMRPQGNTWPRSKPQHSKLHKTLPLESLGDEVFWGVNGKLDFLTWEHPKNCIYVTWVMKRPNGLWEGFYHLRRCLCTKLSTGHFPPNIYLREKSSLLNQLWFIYRRGKWNGATFDYFSSLCSCLIPSTTFLLVVIWLTQKVKVSHWVWQSADLDNELFPFSVLIFLLLKT